jgi:uncharacterized protein YjbI with pentapeptide repeats
MNLSNISIPCADLSSACLYKTNFTNANLKNVVFDKTYCVKTKFNKADMTGARFGIQQTIKFK